MKNNKQNKDKKRGNSNYSRKQMNRIHIFHGICEFDLNTFVKFIIELYANWNWVLKSKTEFSIQRSEKGKKADHSTGCKVNLKFFLQKKNRGKRRKNNTQKNTKKREESKRPTTNELLICSRQWTKRFFYFCSSSFVRRFVIFILFSNDFGLLVATSLWWHRQ